MKLIVVIVGCTLALVAVGILLAARRKGNRLRDEIRGLDRARLDAIFDDVVHRLKPAYPNLDPANYAGTIALLERELRSNGEKFIALLQRENYFEFWIINLGVFLGEFIRRHAAAPGEWAYDDKNGWRVRFKVAGSDYLWDPFTEAHKQYLSSASELLLGMALLRDMK